MESHRQGYRLIAAPTLRKQAGITALGFLILATLVGVVGLAALKITPMYIKNMRMTQILDNVQNELNGQNATPITIRQAIAKQFAVNDINMDIDAIKITQSKSGYAVNVNFENRAPYVADVYLVVAYNKQVEIRK